MKLKDFKIEVGCVTFALIFTGCWNLKIAKKTAIDMIEIFKESQKEEIN